MTTLPTVTALYRYPVKSLRGHALDAATIGARGIDGDRRWMIVDADGRFLTRREMPDMAVFDVRIEGDALVFDHPLVGTHRAPCPTETALRIDARIWNDSVSVRMADAETNDYLSRALGRPVRVVFQGNEGVRPVSPKHAVPGDHVSLSDGYPLLIVTRASLDALNAALVVPVPIARFRPNLVVDGGDAWGEDRWRRIRIGAVTFRTPKLCSRCVIVTQQPLTGERLEGNEPLTTLRRLGRMAKSGVVFGQNAIPENDGVIVPGDRVEVLEAGESVLG
ncbi:MOSC domain-containing protein [Sphingomonas populi]|uniref:MOSC domain-containing protein n=1 Tax=Sphingomonas populi TaxID=2484750 RepID=A0A4V2DDR0_9SPHN|nr:MOSC N-terminal beta barrel domain-containing protein [Sphingomonas populi]RZF65858.1 MOSC domain-containing protein [Sphingomonas populi]